MTPTKQAELRVQLEHAARRPQRLGLPEDTDRVAATIALLVLCAGFFAAVSIVGLLLF